MNQLSLEPICNSQEHIFIQNAGYNHCERCYKKYTDYKCRNCYRELCRKCEPLYIEPATKPAPKPPPKTVPESIPRKLPKPPRPAKQDELREQIRTHDIQMMLNFFKKVKNKNFKKIDLPNFNKAVDDRFPKKNWYKIKDKPDVIIFEGWCVGAKAEVNKTLKKSINSFEKVNDQKLVWRKHVNQQLKSKYKKLYSQLNCMIYLKAKNFSLLQKWRLKQEHKLWLKTKKSSSHKIMSKGDVINFMHTYQRVTENMFKKMPKYASIILNLNSNHQIKSAVYKRR